MKNNSLICHLGLSPDGAMCRAGRSLDVGWEKSIHAKISSEFKITVKTVL